MTVVPDDDDRLVPVISGTVARGVIDRLPRSEIERLVDAGEMAGTFVTDEAGALIFLIDGECV